MSKMRLKNLDGHDRKRFVELTPKVDADAEREAEFLAAVFAVGAVRQSWRAAHRSRINRLKRKA